MASNLEPNLVLPLAVSYNQRGVAGFTNAIVNNTDQKKVNCIYETVPNALTGKTTLYLSKRPGAVVDAASFGTTGQVGYLTCLKASPASINTSQAWVFSTSGDDVRVSDSAGTTVIATAAGYAPTYVDRTAISATDTVVLQTRNAAGAQRIFYSNTIGTWGEITDADFTSAPVGKMEHMDGFAFVLNSSNQISNSDINSLANWTDGSFITKQIKQDIALGLARFGQQIIAFGANTFEVFRNAGNPSLSPLESVQGMAKNFGLGHPPTGTNRTHYYAIAGGIMYFLGRGIGGDSSVGLYAYNGGSDPEKVSTLFIDEILANALAASADLYSVEAFGFRNRTAVAIRFDLNTAATQRWLMFFPEHKEWFEWNSTVIMPVNGGGFFMGVGANQHKLYTIGGVWADDSTNYTMRVQFKLPRKGSYRKRMLMSGVIGDTDTSANSLSISYSDDDGANYSSARTIDMTKVDKTITRCGSYKERFIRLDSTNAREVRLESFIARIA